MATGRQPITGLRRWLKQTPHPHSVRLDGKSVLRIGNHTSRWAECEQSIEAMGVCTVEALDANGDVLRAFAVREPEEEKPRMQREEWPESETAQIAQAITAACDRAAARHENAYRMSFDKLSEMYQAQALRLEEATVRCNALEATLRKMYEKMLDASMPDNETATADGLMTTVLAQAAQSLMAGKANGKAATNAP